MKKLRLFLFDAADGHFLSSYTGIFSQDDGTDCWVANGERSWHGRLVTDGEDYYYVSSGGNLHRSNTYWIGDTNNLLPQGYYTFDEDAKILKLTGFNIIDGITYYYNDNWSREYAGLIKINDDYYYVNSHFEMVAGKEYYVSKTNGLMDPGIYSFDANGRMIIEDAIKNGLIEEDGVLEYYENGVRVHAGVIKVGDDYYYIKSNGTAVRDVEKYAVGSDKTNGLVPAGTYKFDKDGKMVFTQPKNGLIEEEGKKYYYVDDVKTAAGLIIIDRKYYYIKSDGSAVTNCSYFTYNTNGLMPVGTYTYDIDGCMVMEQKKNGLIEEDDQLYYYVDGVKTHAGLIMIGSDYYYIKSNCTAVRNCDYFIGNDSANNLLPAGTYSFDNDGKMIL